MFCLNFQSQQETLKCCYGVEVQWDSVAKKKRVFRQWVPSVTHFQSDLRVSLQKWIETSLGIYKMNNYCNIFSHIPGTKIGRIKLGYSLNLTKTTLFSFTLDEVIRCDLATSAQLRQNWWQRRENKRWTIFNNICSSVGASFHKSHNLTTRHFPFIFHNIYYLPQTIFFRCPF